MNSIYKMVCLGLAFVVTSSGFAQTPEDASVTQTQTKTQTQTTTTMKKTQQQAPAFEQGMGLPANKYPAAYNAEACISVKNGWDFDVFASFIYWHSNQDFMDIAYVPATSTLLSSTTFPGTVAFQNPKYEPGFKAGFGVNTNYDGWTFWGEYTWLHQKIKDTYNAPSNPGFWSANDWFTFHSIAGASNTGTAVSSSWKLGFDMADLVFSRPFYEGAQLVMLPYAGFRGLWLRQNFDINMLNAAGVTTATSNNNSHSWSVGPVSGMMGHWYLGSGFRFEGKAAGSILYTRYTKISHSEQDSQALLPGVLGVSSGLHNLNTLRPVAQLGVGLGWGTYCCNNELYFDLSAEYEFLYLWEQNVMREWVGLIQGYADAIGALQMHGLTLSFRFDF